jgi:hypothetical protein
MRSAIGNTELMEKLVTKLSPAERRELRRRLEGKD